MLRGHRHKLRSALRHALAYRRRRFPSPGASTRPSQQPLSRAVEHGSRFSEEFGRVPFGITVACPNVRFIHIGKTGGSTVRWELLSAGVHISEFHVRKPVWQPDIWYYFWIRNPLRRFVSAFNFSKEILAFDLSQCDKGQLTMENCPAPQKIQSRIEHGYAFEPSYDALLPEFDSANALAGSLASNSPVLKRKALALMRHRQEHIFKGIGWYLDNGAFVRNFHRQILLVGRLESFDRDLARLEEALGVTLRSSEKASHKRKGGSTLPRDLSSTAVANLKRFYAKSDYAALQELKAHGFISAETYDRYCRY